MHLGACETPPPAAHQNSCPSPVTSTEKATCRDFREAKIIHTLTSPLDILPTPCANVDAFAYETADGRSLSVLMNMLCSPTPSSGRKLRVGLLETFQPVPRPRWGKAADCEKKLCPFPHKRLLSIKVCVGGVTMISQARVTKARLLNRRRIMELPTA